MSENQMELHDENLEVVDEMANGHDMEKAEKESADSVEDAAEKGVKKQAPARRGDKRNSQGSELKKTKAAMVTDMYNAFQEMDKQDLAELYHSMFADVEEGYEIPEVNVEVDYQEDLDAICESEGTLSDEFREKTAVIFEAALKSKLSQEIDRLEENYATELEEEVTSFREELSNKVDRYLNYVVETWMEENQLAIHEGIRTDIAEEFMDKLHNLFTESYITVPEGKVDLVDELAEQVEELEQTLSDTIGTTIAVTEELEMYKREAILAEECVEADLAATQLEKLRKLTEDVEFEDEQSFAEKVHAIRESYFTKKTSASDAGEELIETHEDDSQEVEVNSTMSRYVDALRKMQN